MVSCAPRIRCLARNASAFAHDFAENLIIWGKEVNGCSRTGSKGVIW